MKKLSLKLEDLQVDSFVSGDGDGGVLSHESTGIAGECNTTYSLDYATLLARLGGRP